jgi:TRAP transporter TAXI family solute receptor
MRIIKRLVLAMGLAWLIGLPAAARADDPRTLARQGAVGVIAGGIDGTYMRVAADLSAVLDAGGTLRILPMIGKGSVQNLYDLRYLRGIDVAIVQSDALTYLRQDPRNADVTDQIRYVTKLYNEEFHILATKDIQSVADLKGRRVNTDLEGSGTGMTASIVFKALGIPIEENHLGQNDALTALTTGKLDAAIFVVGKPAKLFSTLDAAQGLHFIAVPLNPALLATYLPAQLSHDDYPALVPADAPVDTVAVGAVMAIYNLPSESERYHRATAFVESFFGSFDKFLVPPRHPKWREVNLASDLPGWRRFDPAADWLRKHGKSPGAGADADLRRAFDVYLDQQAKQTASPPPTAEQKAALFEQFQQWQKTSTNPASPAAARQRPGWPNTAPQPRAPTPATGSPPPG